MSPDLAVGGRASEALKTALDKLSSSLLEEPNQRKAVFKKMVEVLCFVDSHTWKHVEGVHACRCVNVKLFTSICSVCGMYPLYGLRMLTAAF